MQTQLKITKSKPIPESRTFSLYADTMRKLKVGESFFIAGFHNNGKFYSTARRLGIKVTVRQDVGDGDGNTGFRIWRIA